MHLFEFNLLAGMSNLFGIKLRLPAGNCPPVPGGTGGKRPAGCYIRVKVRSRNTLAYVL